MIDMLLTSSVLIVLLLGLRWALRRRISRRLQYALWLLAALRLLIPGTVFDSPVSVLSGAETLGGQLQAWQAEGQAAQEPAAQSPVEASAAPVLEARPETAAEVPSAPAGQFAQTQAIQAEASPFVSWAQIARWGWYAGMGAMASWFCIGNIRFARRLRRERRHLPEVESPVPVYVVESLDSPCLWGLFRPAIYVTPACLADRRSLGHIVAHELTHRRHGDLVWSVVRCLCLIVYWFDPLVWLGAAAARQDCELACDEGTLRRLGEAERIPYGRTLVAVVARARRPGALLETATTMGGGGRSIWERVRYITKAGRTSAWAALLAVALAAAAAGCTFTGAAETAADVSPRPVETEAAEVTATPAPMLPVENYEVEETDTVLSFSVADLYDRQRGTFVFPGLDWNTPYDQVAQALGAPELPVYPAHNPALWVELEAGGETIRMVPYFSSAASIAAGGLELLQYELIMDKDALLDSAEADAETLLDALTAVLGEPAESEDVLGGKVLTAYRWTLSGEAELNTLGLLILRDGGDGEIESVNILVGTVRAGEDAGASTAETAPLWDSYYTAPFAAGSEEEAAAMVAGAFLAEAAGEAGIEAAEETALVLQETWTDLTEGQVHVYRLSYRLRPVDMESYPLAGGVGVEDGWLYPQDEFLFLWENQGDYQLAGLATQESCLNVFDGLSGTWRLAAMWALSSHPDLSLKEEAEYDTVLSVLLESEGDFLPEGASDGRAYGFSWDSDDLLTFRFSVDVYNSDSGNMETLQLAFHNGFSALTS